MTVTKRTLSPVFTSRWKGNLDARVGSIVAARTLESIGRAYPGRLMDTPRYDCVPTEGIDFSGRSVKNGREDTRFWLTYILRTIVRYDALPVQITIKLHRVPGPRGCK